MTATSLREDTTEQIIGISPALRRAVASADRFAPTSLSVLIVGETGTGKELIARRIHRMSGRAGHLLDINCASLRPELAESVLFGHRRGSFTGAFESTDGIVHAAAPGTLFLDEIDSLHPEVQAKLLRFLDNGEFRRVGDVAKRRSELRIVSAVHDVIRDRLADGEFRQDLYHRLAMAVIHLPPLRERREDLKLLAAHFASGESVSLSPDFIRCLFRYDWPGNVRELRSFIARAAIGSVGRELGSAEFAEAQACSGAAALSSHAAEAEWLRGLCEQAGSNAEAAAELAGIPRSTFYRKLRNHGIRIIRTKDDRQNAERNIS